MAHISNRTTQYFYFNTLFGGIDWTNKKILDFAGNIGPFLLGCPDNIRPEDYTCLDVDKVAIEIGKKNHPRGNFEVYNRYSCYDNPEGIVGFPIPYGPETFDIVIAFSVFNHVSKPDMLELVGQLRNTLKPGGIMGFTYFEKFYDPTQDPDWDLSAARPDLFAGSNIAHRISQFTPHDPREAEKLARDARWCTIVGEDFRIEPPDDAPPLEKEGSMFLQFYDTPYMQSLFPDGEIKKPVSPERQHCVIFRN
ncbi:MAG: class I SAM-dependent methyltransferase [Bacteroidia bacterium]|nr:class I SAM-dependent methyltransferase [Bacteroidia bacterium]